MYARIKTVAGENEELALQAMTFIFMQTGSPCIYYGTEMGMSGDNDPDCRKPMDWDKKYGPVWQEVHKLVKFRLKYASTLGQGTTTLEVTKGGVIKVTRKRENTITAYFNTTGKDQNLIIDPQLSQNYQDGVLAKDGYATVVE